MKYTYKDFVTGRPRWTRGKFIRWTKGGPLRAWYAVFARRSDALFVPEWCVSAETLAAIGPHAKD